MQPMPDPENVPIHPVRDLQERCQQHGLELQYEAKTLENSTVDVWAVVAGKKVGTCVPPCFSLMLWLCLLLTLSTLLTL